MSRIRSSVKSITSLVDELLDLSRLEAGFDTHRETVHIEDVLKTALETLEGQIKINNQKFQVDIGNRNNFV